MIVPFVNWFASDVLKVARGDMKLTFISVVAAFLLHSVIAERNGPTNLSPRRRFDKSSGEYQTLNGNGGLIRNVRNEKTNARRRTSILKVTGVLRTSGTPQRKFPGMTVPKNPFITPGGYARSQEPKPRIPGRFSRTEFRQARRSFDLGIPSSQLSALKINDDAIFLEPVIRQKPRRSFLADSFGADFSPDSNDVLGPSIGPLNFPGIGKSVYIRLMVPPGEETASHVTVHLVKKGVVEPFSDIYGVPVFARPQKPKPLSSGQNLITLALIHPEKLITSSPGEANSGRSRLVNKSVRNFGFHSSKEEAFQLLRAPNQQKIPHEMPNRNQAEFSNPRQYSAAANHHELPIVLRPAENLIDLPIYPPLSAAASKDQVEGVKNNTNVFTGAQIDMQMEDDAEQSASSAHAFVSRNYSASPIAWLFSGSKAVFNRGESPEPVFMEEIKAPDLSTGNTSRVAESSWVKSKNEMVSNNADEFADASVNMKLENSGRTAAGLNADNPDGGFRSTTSNASLNETSEKTNTKIRG